jgi:hypothetical protein
MFDLVAWSMSLTGISFEVSDLETVPSFRDLIWMSGDG